METGEKYILPGTPENPGVKKGLFWAVAAVLVGANGYLYNQVNNLQTQLTSTKAAFDKQVADVRDASTVTVQTNRQNLNALRDELAVARRQASQAAGQAKTDATKHAEELARRLGAEQAKQEQAAAQTRTELASVKETATTATTKIGEVSTEVGTVKSEVASTKSELEKTIGDLKRVTGDQGVMSGLVATNGKELQALRALGERNYFEFTANKSKQSQKVGDIVLTLKKTDPKRNKYTVELVADDKKVEKKDKNVNEPLQFYVAKSKQPYELVINEVKKDQIVGYLSTPKVQQARN